MDTDTVAEAARLVRELREELIQASLAALRAASPEAWERLGEAGRASCRKDLGYHYDYLAEALRLGDGSVFSAYAEWLGRLFAGLRLPPDCLRQTFEVLRAALASVLPPGPAAAASDLVGAAEAMGGPGAAGPGIGQASPLGETAAAYLGELLAGDRSGATARVMALVRSGAPIKSIYLEVFQPSQYELGRLWLSGGITVAQEHYCTAATQAIMSQLYPLVFATPRNGRRLVAAGVGQELHEIGIRMIADLFELEGWSSYYLGANSPPSSIVAALRERKADLLCLSVTMAPHLAELEAVVRLVREAFPGGGAKILAGGGPFNASPGLWRRVGADGSAADAAGALELAASLMDGP